MTSLVYDKQILYYNILLYGKKSKLKKKTQLNS